MALNFGLLDTSIPERLGAMPANALAMRRQRVMQDEDRAFQREGQQMQNALARMQMTKAQGEMEQEQAYRNALSRAPAGDWNAVLPEIRKVAPDRAMALEKQLGEMQKGKAETRAKMSDVAHKKLGMYREALVNVNSPQQFAQWLTAQHSDPDLQELMGALPSLEDSLATIPQDPREFEQMKVKSAVGIGKFMEMNKPSDFERTMDAAGLSPEQRQAAARQRLMKETTHAPAAVTNVSMALEREEQKEKGKSNVALYGDIRTQASVARKLNAQLESQARVLDKGFATGFGTEAKAAAASVLGALGVEKAEEFATDAQRFGAAAKEVVLQKQLAQKGPQTESDAKRIEQTGTQLGNTPQANRFVLDVAIEQNRRDIAQQKFFDDYWRKTGSYEGAEAAWYDGEGGKSLFESPRLKKYDAPSAQTAARSGARTISSDAEYNALPSGALFVGPDGKQRRKP